MYYDHNQSNLPKAIGLPKDNVIRIRDEILDFLKNGRDTRVSRCIEFAECNYVGEERTYALFAMGEALTIHRLQGQ